MQRTWVRLLHTQPHSCHRCCSVWPCGWHGMLLCTHAQPPLVAHCGLTALYVICIGADNAGPPHMQALGEWPLRHYQTSFMSCLSLLVSSLLYVACCHAEDLGTPAAYPQLS